MPVSNPIEAMRRVHSGPSRRQLLAAAAAMALPAGAGAQAAWPAKPVTVIVPFAPGGAGNGSVRILAEVIGPKLGQSVVVENRPGGGGIPGTQAVTQSTDDHLLLMGSTTMTILPALRSDLPYDVQRDLQPVGMISSQPMVLAVAADSPLKTLDDLVAQGKGGQLTAGNSGVGTLSHLATELINRKLGTQIMPVPYKGDAVLIPDVASGTISIGVMNLPVALPLIQAGRLRALAVTSGAAGGRVARRAAAAHARRRVRHHRLGRAVRCEERAAGGHRTFQRPAAQRARRCRRARPLRRLRRGARGQHAGAAARVHPQRDGALGRRRAQPKHQARIAARRPAAGCHDRVTDDPENLLRTGRRGLQQDEARVGMEHNNRRRVAVIGTPVDVIDWHGAIRQIAAWGHARQSRCVCLVNAHSAVSARFDAAHAEALRHSDLATADGAPVAWMLRQLGAPAQVRLNGPDLMWRYLAAQASSGSKVFFYGGSASTLALLCSRVAREFPGIEVVGAVSPPFRALTRAGGRRRRGAHQRLGRPRGLRRPGLPQAGSLDGSAPRAHPRRDGRRGRGVRLPRGRAATRTGLDAARRPRMGVPPGHGAAPALAPVSRHQHGLRVVRRPSMARRAPGRRVRCSSMHGSGRPMPPGDVTV